MRHQSHRIIMFSDMKKQKVYLRCLIFIGGELIQQQNPDKIYTGEGKDRIGPGHYEIKRELANKYKGTNWHVSNVKRLNENPNKTADNPQLGPGAYEIEKTTSLVSKYQKKKQNQSSYFGTRSYNSNARGGGRVQENTEESSETESDFNEVNLLLFIKLGRDAWARIL